MFIEEQTLLEVLTFVGLRELPKMYNPNSGLTWIKAVALIKKRNCMRAYAIVNQRADGYISYEKTFGSLSPIDGLVSIYPYIYLDEELLKKSQKLDRVSIALSYIGKEEQILGSDDINFGLWQKQYAMDLQITKRAEEVGDKFGVSILEEDSRDTQQEELSEGEVLAKIEDEGECIMEVQDINDISTRKRRITKTKSKK